MSSRPRLSTLAGFSTGLAALALFSWLVGPERLGAVLAGVRPLPFALGLLAATGALGARYLSLTTLLGARPSVPAVLAYLRGVYGKQLLPVGNVTGPVLTAYSMRSATGISAERGLAATLTAEVAGFVGSATIATTGAMLLVAGGADDALPLAVGFAVVLLGWLAVLGALVAGADLEPLVTRVARLVSQTVGRLSAAVRRRTEPAAVSERYAEFEAAQRLLREHPQRLVVAVGWSLLGWLLFCLPALAVGVALDVTLPVAVVLVAVPLSDLLNALPLPGGIGGVELALAGALVALSGLDVTTAAAVAFTFRLCTYWFVLLVGGAATATLSLRPGGS